MNSSHWFPWPVLFFLFIIIYCPIVAAVCTQLNFPHSGQETAPWHQTSLDWFSQRQGGTCPLLALCVEAASGPSKPPMRTLPSRHPVQTAAWGPSHGSPTQPLGKAPLISAEYYVISFYLHVYCLSSQLCGNILWRATMGNHRTNLVKSLSPGASGLPVAS